MAIAPAAAGDPVPLQRVAGRVRIDAAGADGRTRVVGLAERGGYRARVTSREPCHVHVVNPTGGLAGGDVLELDVTAGPEAVLLVTTPAPERVYRSPGPETRVRQRLRVGTGGRLEFLPQPTTFYDGVRYRRTLDLEIAPGGAALVADVLAFGRAARGERLEDVAIHDAWRVRRGARLAFAEAFRLVGSGSDALARPALGDGARASALCLYVADDAAAYLDAARSLLDGRGGCGASLVDDVLAVRWLAADPVALVTDLRAFLTALRGVPLPRDF
jgi:urease accessory protein